MERRLSSGIPVWIIVTAVIARLAYVLTIGPHIPYQPGTQYLALVEAGSYERYGIKPGTYSKSAFDSCQRQFDDGNWLETVECAKRTAAGDAHPQRIITNMPGLGLYFWATYKVFGTLFSEEKIMLLNAIIDVVFLVMFYFLTRELFGKDIAAIATAIYAVFPLQIAGATAAFRDQFPEWALIASTWLYIQWIRKRKDIYAILSGVVLGVVAWVRILSLVIGGTLFIHYIYYSLKNQDPKINRGEVITKVAKACIYTTIIPISFISPWIFQNYTEWHKLFITTQTGHALYTGIGQISNPWGIEFNDVATVARVQEKYPHITPNDPQYNEITVSMFFELVKKDPAFFLLKLYPTRVLWLLLLGAPMEWKKGRAILSICLAVLGTLAVIGLARIIKRLNTLNTVLLFEASLLAVLFVIFHFNARNLLPILPIYYISAAAEIERGYRWLVHKLHGN